MKTVHTDKAPAAVGPYSQAKICGNLVFLSGQIAIDPATNTIKAQTIEEHTEQICKNIIEVLKAAGTSIENVVKTTCFLAEMSDFAAFNEVYAKYFVSSPARSCVAAKALPKGVLAEIEVIAEIV